VEVFVSRPAVFDYGVDNPECIAPGVIVDGALEGEAAGVEPDGAPIELFELFFGHLGIDHENVRWRLRNIA
jgi:hypothetical protein